VRKAFGSEAQLAHAEAAKLIAEAEEVAGALGGRQTRSGAAVVTAKVDGLKFKAAEAQAAGDAAAKEVVDAKGRILNATQRAGSCGTSGASPSHRGSRAPRATGSRVRLQAPPPPLSIFCTSPASSLP
jgi:hypothetical protein